MLHTGLVEFKWGPKIIVYTQQYTMCGHQKPEYWVGGNYIYLESLLNIVVFATTFCDYNQIKFN